MVETYATPHALAQAAAQAVTQALDEGLRLRKRASLVATGGRSPGPVYDLLRDADLDWARIDITFSDERCVAADDAQSNQKLLTDHLLQGAAAQAHVVPLWPQPEEAALAVLQPFDLLMLGMGEDGHVASLIPGSPTLGQGLDLASERQTVLTPPGVGNPPVQRISLTLPALLRARLTLILIAGDAKRRVIEDPAGNLPVHKLLQSQSAPVRILWAQHH
jgi:6-phosphogluconolactonase